MSVMSVMRKMVAMIIANVWNCFVVMVVYIYGLLLIATYFLLGAFTMCCRGKAGRMFFNATESVGKHFCMLDSFDVKEIMMAV